MIDLSGRPEYNVEITAKYFKRAAPMAQSLEMDMQVLSCTQFFVARQICVAESISERLKALRTGSSIGSAFKEIY